MRRLLRACVPPALLYAGLLAAGPAEPAKIAPLKFTDTRLANGLRVIIAEDHYAPLYSIAVTYNTGSRNERKGRTGFAHLFEHMMFKGSEKVGPGEHFFLVYNNGGNMNGSTSTDRTNYYETLPKNQLDLGLFLESDRMRSLAITPENLDNQRATVQEERRQSVDNRPYGKTQELIDDLVYDNFAYKHSVIGSMEDLNAASIQDVKDFFRTYYAPNNATLTLVGDLNTADALARVQKYFGDIPRQQPPPPVDMTEPPQTQERRTTLSDPLARLPRLDMVFKGPFGNTPDAYALSVLGTILGGAGGGGGGMRGGQGMGGENSSRLYQKLVKEKEAAVMVMAMFSQRRGPGTFRIVAVPRPGKSPEEVEALITEEIARLQADPPTEKEMLRVRSGARRSAVQMREGSLFLAMRLGEYATFFDDPGLINTQLGKVLAVTPAAVQSAAKTYLNPSQRTVVYTLPGAGGPRPRAPKPAQ